MKETATRTPSGWMILGVLALILGVTLGILIKPFGGPAPLTSKTHPAATDQSPNHEEGHPPQDDLCSSGVEDGRIRAGALSVEAPSSPEWKVSDSHRHPEAYCSNLMEYSHPEHGHSFLMVFQVPPSTDPDRTREEIIDWARASMFTSSVFVSELDVFARVDETGLEKLDGSQVLLMLSDEQIGLLEVYVADDGEHGTSVILTTCATGPDLYCDKSFTASSSMRLER